MHLTIEFAKLIDKYIEKNGLNISRRQFVFAMFDIIAERIERMPEKKHRKVLRKYDSIKVNPGEIDVSRIPSGRVVDSEIGVVSRDALIVMVIRQYLAQNDPDFSALLNAFAIFPAEIIKKVEERRLLRRKKLNL